MCVECWEDAGSPTTWNEQIKRAVELIAELYAIHSVGGPLHTAVDDYNLDGVITPYYDCYTDEELDAPWYDGWLIAELPSEAPAAAEGLGRNMRQVCDELAALLNAMSVEERVAAVARHDGFIDDGSAAA